MHFDKALLMVLKIAITRYIGLDIKTFKDSFAADGNLEKIQSPWLVFFLE